MRIRSIFIIAILACFTIISLEVRAQKTKDTETSGQASVDNMSFPPVPINLTNPPTIGDPSIMDLESFVRIAGGADVTNTVISSIGDQLLNSGRFNLTDTTTNDYQCQIRLNGLQIKIWKVNEGIPLPGFFTNFQGSQMKIHASCGISMRVMDLHSHRYIAARPGNVDYTDNLGNLLNLWGITATNSVGTVATNAISASLIQQASHQALSSMLPNVDAYLLRHQNY